MKRRIVIRNVPQDVYDRLSKAASDEKQSISEYVLDLLTEAARRPTNAELKARLEAYLATQSTDAASGFDGVQAIREAREELDRRLDERFRS